MQNSISRRKFLKLCFFALLGILFAPIINLFRKQTILKPNSYLKNKEAMFYKKLAG